MPTYRDAIIITDIKEILALPRLARALQDSRGHRRYGSAALECVEVAVGRAGAFVHMWVSPWDIAAATLIATECGALATRMDGTPLDARYKGSILLGTPNVHATLVECLIVLSAVKRGRSRGPGSRAVRSARLSRARPHASSVSTR